MSYSEILDVQALKVYLRRRGIDNYWVDTETDKNFIKRIYAACLQKRD